MERLEGRVRRACEQYGMIAEGDRIAVAVSGGKDSFALLCCLANLRRYYEHGFSLCAITADGRFSGSDTDFSSVTALCDSLGVEHIIKRTNIGEVVFDIRDEKNPCSLCARLRRGSLHDICVERGFNKIALGHHMDDAVETFFMNLFNEGRVGCFSPVSYLSRKDITQIRPLVFCTEREIAAAVVRRGLVAVRSGCKRDGESERQAIKEFIAAQNKLYPDFLTRTFGAMMRSHIGGF